MSLRNELTQYSRDIIDGEIIACQKHKWACMRFMRDLDRENTDSFPFVFDEAAAQRFLDWMSLFKHRKGVLKGQNIEPHIIQKFIFGNIYGWVHRETGYRRFTKAYWQVGRKNAKSQSLSCVASYELMALGEGASEVYCAATKTQQARIVWDETKAMLEACHDLRGKFKVAYSEIVHPKTGSIMRALSKEDSKTGDGFNPQCGIIDEYHAHQTTEMYDIIDSGMIARAQPLIMIITTAGFELDHPCYRIEYHLVSKIINPAMEYENDNYFVMINELDKDDDGKLIDDLADESCWVKANPIACSYPEGIASVRRRLDVAQEAPEKMRDFKTKNMNIWINERACGYMPMNKWGACKGEIPDLTGKSCIIGVDLSTRIDLTSVAFEFLADGKYVILSHSFMPEDRIAERMKTDKMPFDLWVENGYITATEGSVIDYNHVQNYIVDMVEKNNWSVKEVCFDPFNCQQFANQLHTDKEYECIEVRQGRPTLSEPTKSFRISVYEKRVIHDGNPVLEWAVSNAVTSSDDKENIMLDKSKSTQRIDPIAAVINAHVRSILFEDDTSVYESRGMLIF